MNNRTLLFTHLSVPTDPCREAFQRRKQSMYRNRKKYIKPDRLDPLPSLLLRRRVLSPDVIRLFYFKELPSFRSGGRHDAAGSLLFSKDPAAALYTIQMSVTGTVTGSALALIVPFRRCIPAFPSWARRLLRLLIQILRSFRR